MTPTSRPMRASGALFAVTLLSMSAVALQARPAHGAPTECRDATPAGTYADLVVPEEATCTLRGSVVHGNVRVLPGGTLFVDSTTVAGHILGRDVNRLFVGRSSIGGNIVVNGGEVRGALGATLAVCATNTEGNVVIQHVTGGIGVRTHLPGFDPPNGFSARCGSVRNTIAGNLIVSNNASIRMLVQDNVVHRNLIVVNNAGTGQKVITRNLVDNVVACHENDQPFRGDANAAVRLSGQCESPG